MRSTFNEWFNSSSVTIRNDLPPTASPQTLSLGNFLFSSNNTLFPAIAAYEAAALPPATSYDYYIEISA